jgi:Prokaryotic membrane lipoprotein lipid attachment site
MKRYFTIAVALLALAACTDRGPPAPNIPADGKIHVMEKKGRFVILPTTLFCQSRNNANSQLKRIGIEGMGMRGEDLTAAFEKIGQSDYLRGSGRYGELHPQHCPDDGKNIIIEGAAGLNTAGKPYALMLSARQGPASAPTAVVRVAVARTEGVIPNLQIPVTRMDHDKTKRLESLMRDGTSLSETFITHIFGVKK